MDDPTRHQVLEALPVPDAARFQRKRFPRVAVRRSQTTGQQRDSLRERGLARIVRSNEDGQRSKFHLGAPGVALVPFETESSEFHSNYMIPGGYDMVRPEAEPRAKSEETIPWIPAREVGVDERDEGRQCD